MINKLLVSILLTAFISQLVAQENRKENGVKVGRWEHKDSRDKIYAEGNYNDGVKEGRWLYYVSPISRQTHVSDVKGDYNPAGQKTGTWSFISTSTRIQVDANFTNGLMDGACTYYSPKGNILATCLMSTGIRHGQWVFYHNGKQMTKGFYQNGIKIGNWAYDYYPDPAMHVKGMFNFDEGTKNGKLEYYRVDHHPKFGTEELLSGIGTYSNGRKTGRWIEYNQNLVEKRDKNAPKGELVETGNYDRNGKRRGYWKSTIGRKNYKAAMYENGALNGKFILYHDNGKIQFETTYKNGSPSGPFIRYYDNGNIEEKGTAIPSPNSADIKKDTIYYTLEIPYEYHFQLVELSNFHRMKHHYVTWISDPAYSLEPAELDRRFALYKDYGLEPNKRTQSVLSTGIKSVRTGEYQAFFRNQKLKLEGSYYPKMTEVFFPETNTYLVDYARDGEWKEYDDNGYTIKTITYDKGTLLKMLDDKGNEMGAASNEEENPSEEEEEEEIIAPE
jgi:antitoxin component YwqK of YwqJK toxin-antitoxin module